MKIQDSELRAGEREELCKVQASGLEVFVKVLPQAKPVWL